ncbi:DUF3108 domain-containing protein [Burkholderia pseudomallei]|uniref:DUF3108 domain-containing protein n=1 Tax=Burkholderia pseudomallei TaxID=28450 RepID=UPI000F1B07D6|nr:DUF3108 domain-containing protein [Burkholderia pseudomallei]CAJ3070628.1 Protein of uncharacterised function (DUF3108) [Burkholderia pseudomallei]VCK72971.1 Protein of uncharacterised function (DUF3108) [Burkholderia pseudomallei]VCK79915.1 Protein of uncharacterised function (DUF3108) [Burkholderia pseudomallei]VCK80106.1 Protein of uncharacterised function (DUF3108) [Burkholderia pseudomallei]VCK80859.1 Protein of uncharacterised function (DUF3108) [Burkholderia pseudomallei]
MKQTNPQCILRAPQRRARASALALAVAGLMGLAAGAAHAQQSNGSGADAPRFAVGDSWTFAWHDELSGQEQQIAEDVKTLNADGSIDVSYNNQSATLSADGNVVKSPGGVYSPAEVKLRFPLRAGDSYSAKYEYFDASGRHWTREMDAKVEGGEKVETKAGSFDAVRVQITGGWYPDGAPGGGGSFNETMWYAPAAKRFVKDVFRSIPRGRGVGNTTQTELVAYTVKP